MKTKSYNVYSFAELSGAARAKAIEQYREFLGNDWDGDQVTEDAQRVLAYAGLKIDRVLYTGFWSQGNGACFEGKWHADAVNAKAMREEAPIDTELHRIADAFAKLAAYCPAASFTVKHDGSYSHRFCTSFSVSICNSDGDEIDTPERDEAEKSMIETARDAMLWIYRQLERDYDWHVEEAQVIASLEANDYEFTADGKIAPRNL